MPDVKRLLRGLDEAETPEVWPDISSRNPQLLPVTDRASGWSGSKGAVLVLALIVTIASLWVVASAFRAKPDRGSSPGSDVSPSPLLGADLADALGLQLEPRFPASGCEFYVEVKNPAGYCLDDLAVSKLDKWVISRELQGHIPSDQERDCFSAMDRYGNLPGDLFERCHRRSGDVSLAPGTSSASG
jgi:hypothetical protein